MMNKVGVISLGCSKNTVDTEKMLGMLKRAGYVFVQRPEDAEILIVNTCGFIVSAKAESINTILEMAEYKKTGKCKVLAATGCLCQRYSEELKAELPEVDIMIGVNEYTTLVERLNKLTGMNGTGAAGCGRVLTTPPHSAYLRVADGCNNRCTYCAIPLIRGGLRSEPMDSLLMEADELASKGVRELTVIAQDTSGYGMDLYGAPMLSRLLKKLDASGNFEWIRVLYTYPDTVDKGLLDTIYDGKHIVNYLDMPIQHVNDELLQKMNRRGSGEHIRNVFAYVRNNLPDFILRTTVIVGFPGETPEMFAQLCDFFNQNHIDRLGVFGYSQEDGTPASDFQGQIDEEEKLFRIDALMRQQQRISLELNQKRVGNIDKVLIESVEDGFAWGRTYAEAPDVDGRINFSIKRPHCEGEFTEVKLTRASEYDLWGEEA